MAIIKPFKGIRPPQALVEEVASRPYDVLNSEEARAEAEGNEKSLYHIIKPEIDFPVGTDEHDPRVYEKAAQNFQMFQDNGWLVQDEKENIVLMSQLRKAIQKATNTVILIHRTSIEVGKGIHNDKVGRAILKDVVEVLYEVFGVEDKVQALECLLRYI